MSTKEGDHGRATYLLRTGVLPQGPIQYPDARLARGQGTGRRRRRAAELRQHRARSAFFSPAAVRPGLPRPAVRAARRRRQRGNFGRPQAQNADDSALKVAGPRPARRTSTSQADARIDLLDDSRTGLPRRAPRRAPRKPSHRLRPGRSPDALGGGQGLQPRRGEGKRCATPMAATSSARAACSPAGWSNAACPLSKCRCDASRA